MPRVKRGTKRRARRKKYLKRTKGFFLTKSKLYQSAQEAANRAERMPSATVVSRNGSTAVCGFSASVLQPASTESPTAILSMA